jgi:hypothetical protein
MNYLREASYNLHLKRLRELLPEDQYARILKKYSGDIAPDFLGFTEIYENLAAIIPRHFTVIDLGCAYNPQCFYFQKHKAFISVDESDCDKFITPNCTVFVMSIADFIEKHIDEYDLDETFAICSYVPVESEEMQLVKSTFKNLFAFYPSEKEQKS